jgi:hypothetical protein
MALPKSVETPRLRYLQNIVDADEGGWPDWPMLTEDDYTQFGKIVVLYSYIDLNLRRIVEAAGNGGVLKAPWAGRVRKLTIGEAEEAVQSLPDWSEPNKMALDQIVDRRGLRNLIAHFAVRRFPADDAYLFFTKSDRDFKRVYGVDPAPGVICTGIVECSQVIDGFRHIRDLQTWLAKVTAEAEKLFITSKSDV